MVLDSNFLFLWLFLLVMIFFIIFLLGFFLVMVKYFFLMVFLYLFIIFCFSFWKFIISFLSFFWSLFVIVDWVWFMGVFNLYFEKCLFSVLVWFMFFSWVFMVLVFFNMDKMLEFMWFWSDFSVLGLWSVLFFLLVFCKWFKIFLIEFIFCFIFLVFFKNVVSLLFNWVVFIFMLGLVLSFFMVFFFSLM